MRALYLTFFIVIADQLTKIFVKGFSFLGINVQGMYLGESFPVIGDFIKITFVENPGMAFGLDFGADSKIFLSLFSLAASIGIFFYLYKMRNQHLLIRIGLALILGGAIGNLIDRTFYGVFYDYAPLFYGKVVDFVNVEFFDFTLFGRTYERWPIFNVADSAVTIGVILLIAFNKKADEKEDEEENNNGEDSIDSETVAENEIVMNTEDNKPENDEDNKRENI